MTAKGGAWWSNLQTLFAVGEGLVHSTGLCVCVRACVCVCVCECISAIQTIWTGENKDCWHQLLPAIMDHHKARSLFVNR